MPGELALTCATIFASSYVVPPTMKMTISWGLSFVEPPPSTNGYDCWFSLPLIKSCSVASKRGECSALGVRERAARAAGGAQVLLRDCRPHGRAPIVAAACNLSMCGHGCFVLQPGGRPWAATCATLKQ